MCTVQTALRTGAYVVSYDWLEDSLHGRRKLAEKKYAWAAVSKERREKKKFKRMGKKVDGEYSTISFQIILTHPPSPI